MALSLHTLPVELVYRIFDNLDRKTLFLSCRGVCARLNDITDAYHRYQVIFHFIMSSVSLSLKHVALFGKNILFWFRDVHMSG